MSVPGGALRVKVEGRGVGRGAWMGERLSCWYVIGGLCGRVDGLWRERWVSRWTWCYSPGLPHER